jgi:two-component system, chemotaxis family, chemotaxis protein CheY
VKLHDRIQPNWLPHRFQVVDAEDGDKAVKEFRSGGNPFMVNTIICDIHMPNVNGMKVIAFSRQQFPSVPVIVITGEPEIPGACHFLKAGFVAYLVKPISSEKLTRVVHKSVRDHAAR